MARRARPGAARHGPHLHARGSRASERVEPDLLAWTETFFGCPVIDNWWQTGTGWPIAANCLGLGLSPVKPGSVARALPGYQVEIVDDDGHPLPAGEQGHIVIRLPLPPGCLQTLWGDDDRFVSTYLAKFPGYYDTSDAGRLDADGYLWIAGRTDDIINVGGDSLSGLDVEQVLATHPGVERCAVVAAPDPFLTEVPVAFIVPKDDLTFTFAPLAIELQHTIETLIGDWARLRRFVFLGALPHTPSKKIRRSTLRDWLAAASGAAVLPDTSALPLIADISLPLPA